MATAVGSGFSSTSMVTWNGTELATSYQTGEILYAEIPSSFLAKPGSATIVIKDTRSGAASNTRAYAILSPAAANASVVQLVSSGLDGSPANGDSLVQPSISATGRFVVFQSAGTMWSHSRSSHPGKIST